MADEAVDQRMSRGRTKPPLTTAAVPVAPAIMRPNAMCRLSGAVHRSRKGPTVRSENQSSIPPNGRVATALRQAKSSRGAQRQIRVRPEMIDPDLLRLCAEGVVK